MADKSFESELEELKIDLQLQYAKVALKVEKQRRQIKSLLARVRDLEAKSDDTEGQVQQLEETLENVQSARAKQAKETPLTNGTPPLAARATADAKPAEAAFARKS